MSIGIFALLIGLMPSEFYFYQADYETPFGGQDQEVVDYFSANNITIYTNTWVFNISYPNMVWNETGFSSGHRIEFHWIEGGSALLPYKGIFIRHAYPSPLGDWWLFWNRMYLIEPYLSRAGSGSILVVQGEEYGIEKHQLLNLQTNINSSYFEVSDGEVRANFFVLNTGDYESLEDAWDSGELHVLSSYEIDFEAMKPDAFTLITQLVTFQNPNFGIPGDFGTVLNYSFGIGFWIVTALIIYTIITKLIPTIQGGIEN